MFMLVLGVKGYMVILLFVGFILGGLRSECMCGRRMEVWGGVLVLGGGFVMFGGMKVVFVFLEVMGVNILEMIIC